MDHSKIHRWINVKLIHNLKYRINLYYRDPCLIEYHIEYLAGLNMHLISLNLFVEIQHPSQFECLLVYRFAELVSSLAVSRSLKIGISFAFSPSTSRDEYHSCPEDFSAMDQIAQGIAVRKGWRVISSAIEIGQHNLWEWTLEPLGIGPIGVVSQC